MMPRARIERGEHSNIVTKGYVEDGRKANGAKRYRTCQGEEAPNIYRATCRYRGANGYTKQAEAWGPTKNRAETELRAKVAKLTKGLISAGAKVTVEDAATQWIAKFGDKIKAGKVTQQTWDQYSDAVTRLINPRLGGVRMDELTTGTITNALDEMQQLAPSSARIARVVLKHITKYAMQQDWIAVDPMIGTDTYRTKSPDIQILGPEELKQVRQALKAWQGGNRYGPPRGPLTLDVLDLMLGTGCRPGEALALRWEDVDMGSDEQVTASGEVVPAVPATVTIAGTIVDPSKGKAHRQEWTKTKAGYRQLTIGPTVQAMLLRRAGELYEGDGTLVFPARGGGVMSPNNFRRGLREALKQAGVEGFYPYLLRKTNATTIADSVSLEAAAANLGHSDPKITATYYAQRAIKAPDVSEAVEKLFAGLD